MKPSTSRFLKSEEENSSGGTIERMSDIAPSPSTRILVADDEENQRAGLSKMIQSWGFSVETAADGQEALDKLSSMAVHVLVTDLMMPRMDGFELLMSATVASGAGPTTASASSRSSVRATAAML